MTAVKPGAGVRAARPHLGLAQLPLGGAAVVQVQQLEAALSGVSRQRHVPHQRLVPEEQRAPFDFTSTRAGGSCRSCRSDSQTRTERLQPGEHA